MWETRRDDNQILGAELYFFTIRVHQHPMHTQVMQRQLFACGLVCVHVMLARCCGGFVNVSAALSEQLNVHSILLHSVHQVHSGVWNVGAHGL